LRGESEGQRAGLQEEAHMWDSIQRWLEMFVQVAGIGLLIVAAGALSRWLTAPVDFRPTSQPETDRRSLNSEPDRRRPASS
jgi:hypothetical protein